MSWKRGCPLLDHAVLRETYGAAGRDRVRARYTWDRMAAETLNAYRKIQTGSRRTRHRSDEPKANSSTSTGRMETTSRQPSLGATVVSLARRRAATGICGGVRHVHTGVRRRPAAHPKKAFAQPTGVPSSTWHGAHGKPAETIARAVNRGQCRGPLLTARHIWRLSNGCLASVSRSTSTVDTGHAWPAHSRPRTIVGSRSASGSSSIVGDPERWTGTVLAPTSRSDSGRVCSVRVMDHHFHSNCWKPPQ
jgi:hypothetical protein